MVLALTEINKTSRIEKKHEESPKPPHVKSHLQSIVKNLPIPFNTNNF